MNLKKEVRALIIATAIVSFNPVLPAFAAQSLSDVANANKEATVETQASTYVSETQASQYVNEQSNTQFNTTAVTSNNALIDSIANNAVVQGNNDTANRLLSKIKPPIMTICILLAHLIVLWVPLGTLIDLVYITVPFSRSWLSGGATDQSVNRAGGGFGGGFGGNRFGGGGFGGGYGGGFSGANNPAFGNGDGITPGDSAFRSVCLVSNEAMMCTNSSAGQAQLSSPLKLYFKAMITKCILSGVIIVLVLSGVFVKVGTIVGSAISNGLLSAASGGF